MPDGFQEIREGVAQLCRQFPGAYWQRCDRLREYPAEFVDALMREGYLAAMIPEEFGGSGLDLATAAVILEEIHRNGCNAAACHAQMYTMGTLLRHGSDEQKASYLPRIADGALRLQAFGVTEPTSGTDTLALQTTAKRVGDSYVVNGQKIWTSRAEHSDLMLLLARTTPRDQVERRTDGLSVFLIDLRELVGKGITIRPIRTMINHSTTEVFLDNVQNRPRTDRRGGQRLSHPFGNECRAILIAASASAMPNGSLTRPRPMQGTVWLSAS
jgi:alkylation response protein AidB-like acyl-CoA dehydrogenase